MERDRSRHKQEKEAADSSHKAEIVALAASHERAIRQTKESNEAALREMEGRLARAEQQRAKEGGERDADLSDALERERMAVAATARLQEERATLNERITSLTNETSRLETRLEHATSQMELASERERNAEEQLDKALSLHARQLGVRQRRESELEQTVADLAAALVVAKNKVETAMKVETIRDGGGVVQGSLNNPDAEEDLLDLKAQLQDLQDEIETLRAQVSLERRRSSTLHKELQDLSKEHNDELSGAHAKQRQYERKITDLTAMAAKLQSSLRRAAPNDMGDTGDIDGATAEEFSVSSGVQYSGDEKKETDHLRKQISSLSEKIFEQQSRIDHGRGEISTLKNRLRSALMRAETAEKSLEAANQRLIMMDLPMSGMSSADEELGLPGRRAANKHPPVGTKPRGGFRRTSKVESIRSALGLHPGRFPSGGWQEMIASLLDTFDALSVDMGSHFRHYPMSRLAFMMYLFILHTWAFFLLVYHAHAQGSGGEHGPEAMMRSYHYEQAVPKVAAAANITSP
jgi:chromosome segregation ATPase